VSRSSLTASRPWLGAPLPVVVGHGIAGDGDAGPLSADVICLQELWFTDELVDLYDATLRPAYVRTSTAQHRPAPPRSAPLSTTS